jgi:hypothetical protein
MVDSGSRIGRCSRQSLADLVVTSTPHVPILTDRTAIRGDLTIGTRYRARLALMGGGRHGRFLAAGATGALDKGRFSARQDNVLRQLIRSMLHVATVAAVAVVVVADIASVSEPTVRRILKRPNQ